MSYDFKHLIDQIKKVPKKTKSVNAANEKQAEVYKNGQPVVYSDEYNSAFSEWFKVFKDQARLDYENRKKASKLKTDAEQRDTTDTDKV